MIVPPEGRTFFSLKGPDWYDDIEFDMKIVKIQAAANIERATNNHFGSREDLHLSSNLSNNSSNKVLSSFWLKLLLKY
ncbi:hypothetical protein DOY81_007621 [Sarcophaga bullata]|nr:hypothetical protein DOY81_007621 [Sarcophaga bullata]